MIGWIIFAAIVLVHALDLVAYLRTPHRDREAIAGGHWWRLWPGSGFRVWLEARRRRHAP